MAVLKKIRSSTLIEALVATVLIVIVFMVASLVLNNLLLNSFSKNTHAVENRMAELEYQLSYETIQLPYNEEFKDWNIAITKNNSKANRPWINIIAINRKNAKLVTKAITYARK